MNPPFEPTVEVATVLPSGRVRMTFVLQHADVPIVTAVISRLTRWPAVPSNVTLATSPAVSTVTATEGPPGTISYVAALAGTTVRSVA
jgi:hypothetical protein